MTTWITRLDPGPGDGPTVAIKDLIDVAGTPTTCASAAIDAEPAAADAEVVRRIRAAGGRIAGKTNLHELAFGGTGINRHTGTPVNPVDAERIPGGSSSGSAVAVATGEVDLALGTDTAGSIRTPAACCGIVGLKTTFGRLPLDGIQALGPSMDTVGPMARTVAGVTAGMAMLDPAFAPLPHEPFIGSVSRFRLPEGSPSIERAVDRALVQADLDPYPVRLDDWRRAEDAGSAVLFVEASRVHADLLASRADRLGDDVRDRLLRGAAMDAEGALERARLVADRWRDTMLELLDRRPVLCLAGATGPPSLLADPHRLQTRHPNVAISLAGLPAVVLPVPMVGRYPASLQLVARHGEEDVLLAVAARIEQAVAMAADGPRRADAARA